MRSSLKNASAELRRAETGRAAKQGRPPNPERVAAHTLCPATGTACLVERKVGTCIGEDGACAIQADTQKQATTKGLSSHPYSPEQALANKVNVLPPEVFWIVNRLLAERYDGEKATFSWDEVAQRLKEACKDVPFNRYWLNFETVYRGHGWDTVYTPPRDDAGGYWTFTTPPTTRKTRD